ncbi:QcrA and Rieske domain-containing protein [Halosimplex halophilum]|uniref:QcrA and Rieske domain-containing protein n=1 Tax=Halosimplex halophilum TaxID=2559572 RepID=UPI00107F8C33|nr:Rieske 2Fe-2S domain-containing protein [Halosimplex halophilum]
MDEDRYPAPSGRRRFVKGIVGSAALGSLGVAGSGLTTVPTNRTGVGGGNVEAKVIKNTDGPAPRGMSQIPVTVEDGYLKGVWPAATENGEVADGAAKTTLGGVEYSSKWFQYCGIQTHPKVEPDSEADNFLRADPGGRYEWEADLEPGTRLAVEMFDDYEEWGNGVGDAGLGKPAAATWRSVETDSTLPVQVIRSPEIERLAEDDEWLAASTDRGFIAWLNKCTHLCCVPSGFKQSATVDGAENAVYCQCHQSVYDPFDVVSKVVTAFPRPES